MIGKNSRKVQRFYSSLYYSRRLSQFVFLAAFVFLFIKTDYHGSDELDYVVNILFRLDPFLATLTMLASRTIIALMLPAVGVLLFSLLLGRSFCGWFCPLGSLLDGCRKVLPTDTIGKETVFPRLGRILLILAIFLTVLGFHIGGYIDPFSILVRGLAQVVYPAFHGVSESFFTFTYTSAPGYINNVTEPVYSFMKEYLLPAERKYFELVYLSFVILFGVFLLEIAQKRMFCRNICPLGSMLGILSRFGLLRGRGGSDECGKCRVCASLCRMGAIDDSRNIDMAACNLCIECVIRCPRQIISFGLPVKVQAQPTSHPISRRQFLGVIAAGVLFPAVKATAVIRKQPHPLLIRPPGALSEEYFVGRCVRCGECYQVCIGNALQPAFLEGGLDAVFTPKLAARTGYCEYNCTLCGQVCPTGAIRRLTIQEKHRVKIGNAWFDQNRCLPFAKGISCMVCEEHCPTADKAIRFRPTEIITPTGARVMVKQPYVVDDLCIGCGICENKCPLPGRSAIIVTSANEDRDPTKRIPDPGSLIYG